MDSTDLILLLIFIGAGLGVLYTEGMIASTTTTTISKAECQNHPDLPNTVEVKDCYYKVNDLYAVVSDGRGTQTILLGGGFHEKAQEGVDRQLLSATEHAQERDTITKAYNEILCRNPDPGGMEHYLTWMNEKGKSEQWLRDDIASSKECQSKYGVATCEQRAQGNDICGTGLLFKIKSFLKDLLSQGILKGLWR